MITRQSIIFFKKKQSSTYPYLSQVFPDAENCLLAFPSQGTKKTPEKTSETKGENKILVAKKKVGPTSFKWLKMLEILFAVHQQAAEKASEKMRHRMETQTIKNKQ